MSCDYSAGSVPAITESLGCMSRLSAQLSFQDENDMLDLAADVEETSRLGCQVKVSENVEGVSIRLPKSVVSQLL